MSDSLWPHELQHARPPCQSPTPGVHPNPCPQRRWCHPTISSSVIPFSSRPQSFPASGSFQMSQCFASGGQTVEPSALASVLSNEYSEMISFRNDCFDLLAIQWTLKGLLQHHNSKASTVSHSAFFYGKTLIFVHDYWKNWLYILDYIDLSWQSDVSAVQYTV